MNKILNNKWLIIPSLFLLFGAVTVIATTIGDSGFSGIQVDNYFSGSGKQGITQNISFGDADGNNHSLEFEDGLLVFYNLSEPGPYQTQLPASGNLIAYYAFESNSGIIQDSLKINNGTNNGATRGVSGKISNAFDFESSENDFVILDSSVSREFIFSIGRDGTNNDRLSVSVEGIGEGASGWRDSSFTLSSGSWQHVCFTHNSSQARIYVDDDLKDTFSAVGGDPMSACVWIKPETLGNEKTILNTQSNQTIGSRDPLTGDGWYFDGLIDEIGIWNVSLSSGEISEIYNNGNSLTY